MAEAIVNHHLGDLWQASSAGTRPEKSVNPRALQVLEEIGIRHGGRPKHVDEFRQVRFDLVVSVCDSAAEECPIWPGSGKRVHRGLPDPATAVGAEEEILSVFRQVRDEIARATTTLLDSEPA
jgi:arsenate reductase